jgi:hypothetical protein
MPEKNHITKKPHVYVAPTPAKDDAQDIGYKETEYKFEEYPKMVEGNVFSSAEEEQAYRDRQSAKVAVSQKVAAFKSADSK